MSFNDRWLINKAQQKKALTQGPLRKSLTLASLPPVDDLWGRLQQEVARQAKVYTDALGDPGALVVQTPADAIEIRVPDGREMILRVDRARRMMFEHFLDAGGARRHRMPNISFTMNAAGDVTFNFGGLEAVAGSVLRRFVS